MSTATLSTFLAEPKALHEGANIRIGTYNPATLGTLTAASVILLFKIPDRARIVDGYVYNIGACDLTMSVMRATASGTLTLMQKLCSSSASGITKVGIDGAAALAGALDYVVSLSDATVVKEAYVQATVASTSNSLTTKFSITYVMDSKQ